MNRECQQPDRARPRGFTLIEVSAALAISSILFLAIGSAMVLTAQALPGAGAGDAVLHAHRAIDELITDLQFALTFNERTAISVQVTVPDRTGDGIAETIRYEWSAVAGQALTRRVNGGAVVPVAQNVQAFNLTYQVDHEQTVMPTTVQGVETLLKGYSSWYSLADFSVTTTNWPGQYFVPNLPSDALSWTVTRVKFQARLKGSDKSMASVQLRPPTSNKLPSNSVIDERVLDESTLPASYAWQEFSFDKVQGISPNLGLCLVIPYVSGSSADAAAEIRYQSGFNTPLDMVKTTTAGSGWSFSSYDSLLLYVYGQVTQPGPQVTVDEYFVTAVDITLRTDDNAATAVTTGVNILNRPQVSGP